MRDEKLLLALKIMSGVEGPMKTVDMAEIFNVPKPEKDPDWSVRNHFQAWKYDVKVAACEYVADRMDQISHDLAYHQHDTSRTY